MSHEDYDQTAELEALRNKVVNQALELREAGFKVSDLEKRKGELEERVKADELTLSQLRAENTQLGEELKKEHDLSGHWCGEYTKAKAGMEQACARANSLSQDVEQLKREKQSEMDERVKVSNLMRRVEENLDTTMSKLSLAEKDATRYATECEGLRKREEEMTRNLRATQGGHGRLQAEVEKLRKDLQEADAHTSELIEFRQIDQAELKRLNELVLHKGRNVDQLTGQRDRMDEELKRLSRERDEERNRANEWLTKGHDLEKEVVRLREENNQLRADDKGLIVRVNALIGEKQRLQEQVNEMREYGVEMLGRYLKLRQRYGRLNLELAGELEGIQETFKELRGKDSELQDLEKRVRDLEDIRAYRDEERKQHPLPMPGEMDAVRQQLHSCQEGYKHLQGILNALRDGLGYTGDLAGLPNYVNSELKKSGCMREEAGILHTLCQRMGFTGKCEDFPIFLQNKMQHLENKAEAGDKSVTTLWALAKHFGYMGEFGDFKDFIVKKVEEAQYNEKSRWSGWLQTVRQELDREVTTSRVILESKPSLFEESWRTKGRIEGLSRAITLIDGKPDKAPPIQVHEATEIVQYLQDSWATAFEGVDMKDLSPTQQGEMSAQLRVSETALKLLGIDPVKRATVRQGQELETFGGKKP